MSASPDPASPPESAPGPADTGEPIIAVPVAVPTAQLWTWGVGASLAAGLAAWLAGEGGLIAYHDQLAPQSGPFPPPEVALAVIATKKLVATLTFVALGASLGFALGIAGGGARRSVDAAGWAGLAGLLLGGFAAGAAALGLLPIYFANQEPLDDSLVLPLLTHAGVAAAAGVAGGLALGLGMGGGVGRTIGGGLLGAVGGAIVYELVGALAFPSGRTGEPLSATPTTRLFFLLAVALLAAVGAIWMARAPAPKSKSVPPEV
jgi:hypothetical protein